MNRGTISFVFDDGYESVYQHVLPVLQQYGFHGVFAVPLAMPEPAGQPLRPWQQWLAVKNKGHELAAHSATHRDLTTLSGSELDEELRTCQQAWGAKTLVYPGGAYNEAVLAGAQRYFTAARTVQRGFESTAPADPFQLKTFNFSKRNFSLFKANNLALWACVTNSWLIETYHIVDDNESGMVHSVSLRDFKRHLAFVATLPLANKRIYETISHRYNQK